MRKIITIIAIAFSSVAISAPLLNEVLRLEPGKEKLVRIKSTSPVSINIELVTNNPVKAMECKYCLNLSHKLSDGHIAQKNSSSIGVGFIKVIPENGVVQVVVSHNHPTTKNIKITAEPVN